MLKIFTYIPSQLISTYETPYQIICKKDKSRVSIDTTKNITYTYDTNENIPRYKDHKSNSAQR